MRQSSVDPQQVTLLSVSPPDSWSSSPRTSFPRLDNMVLFIHRDAHGFKQNFKLLPPASLPPSSFKLRWMTSLLSSSSFCHPPLLLFPPAISTTYHFLYYSPHLTQVSTFSYFLQEALIDTPRGNQRYTYSSDSPRHCMFIIVLIKVHVVSCLYIVSPMRLRNNSVIQESCCLILIYSSFHSTLQTVSILYLLVEVNGRNVFILHCVFHKYQQNAYY